MYAPKYFKPSEFTRIGCSIDDINEDSLIRLDLARGYAGVPFRLNSAYRSPESEIAAGRSGVGAHTEGRAFDIRCNDNKSRFCIVTACLQAGFHRIGIGKNFVHVDDSVKLPYPRIWLY